jgi:Uma2 family endonuclease
MAITSRQPFVSTMYDRLLIADDTEESVSGSDYHLAAILALYEVLSRYARRAVKRWYVTAEVLVLADIPERVDTWRAMPDVYVVRDTPDTFRASLDTRTGESFPQFICEVASESTWNKDVTEKQRVYADLGALEYIVFDPTAALLGQSLRAWRRQGDGSWDAWEPDDQGFLTSATLDGLRLRAEGTLLRVYDPAGELLPTGNELDVIAHEQAARRSEAERMLETLEARLAETARTAQEQAARQIEAQRIIEAQAAQLAEALRVIEEQAALPARQSETERRMAELEESLARLREKGPSDEQEAIHTDSDEMARSK